MNILKEFMESNEDPVIKSSIGLVVNFYNSNKKMISFNEREDFQQDIILCILRSRQKYDPSIGDFPKLLCWDLRTVLHDVISRYTGIRMSTRQYFKFKENNRAIMICSLNDKEV